MSLTTLLFLLSLLAVVCGIVFYFTFGDVAWLLVLIGGLTVLAITGYRIYKKWTRGWVRMESKVSKTPKPSITISAPRPSLTLQTREFRPPRVDTPPPEVIDAEMVARIDEILRTQLPEKRLFPNPADIDRYERVILANANRFSVPWKPVFRPVDQAYLEKLRHNPQRLQKLQEFLRSVAKIVNVKSYSNWSEFNDAMRFVVKNHVIRPIGL